MSTWIVFYFIIFFLKASLYPVYSGYALISLILFTSLICYAIISTAMIRKILKGAVKQYSEKVKSVIPLKGVYFVLVSAIVTPFVVFRLTGNPVMDLASYFTGVFISLVILKVTGAYGYSLSYLFNGYNLCLIQTEDGSLKICMTDSAVRRNCVCDFFYFDRTLIARRVDNV